MVCLQLTWNFCLFRTTISPLKITSWRILLPRVGKSMICSKSSTNRSVMTDSRRWVESQLDHSIVGRLKSSAIIWALYLVSFLVNYLIILSFRFCWFQGISPTTWWIMTRCSNKRIISIADGSRSKATRERYELREYKFVINGDKNASMSRRPKLCRRAIRFMQCIPI